ncbi:MAG: trp operon repressor [Gammaproteobacteria bacterium]|jgi:TrpR family trp operon transcriptional repressor
MSNLQRQKLMAKGYNKFLTLCYTEKSKAGLKALLDFFLTFDEREAVATRILLVEELLKGEKTQREIAAKLGISIAKITRGSNMLKTLNNKIKQELIEKIVD